MKKNLITLTTLALILSACGDKKIENDALPTEIKAFVSTHFPNNAILQTTIDEDKNSKIYEVKLQDNIQLEFNTNNEITDIDSNIELPTSVIPKKIMEYVNSNYSNIKITDWELDNNNQSIELDNGESLEFTVNGDFIRKD